MDDFLLATHSSIFEPGLSNQSRISFPLSRAIKPEVDEKVIHHKDPVKSRGLYR